MHTAKIPHARIPRKRNVARRILLRSRERLLWLWPQYFPKHDVATARPKTYSLDTFERECDLAEAGGAKRPESPAVFGTRHPGSRACAEFSQGFEGTVAQPDDNACAAAAEHVGNQKTRPGDYWSDPGWRKAARQYHVARAGRLLITEIEPQRLTRLRELLANDVSLDRAWRELNERSGRPAPQVTLVALLYVLRREGLAALENPSCRRRLADLSDDQLREVLAALIRARTNCAAVTDELLVALDEIRR